MRSRGGITALDVTLTTPNALSSIESLCKHYGTEILVGIVSVTPEQHAQDAASAGANFIVSPVTEKR